MPGNLTHMKIVGRDGAVLNDHWAQDGVGAHLGITVAGFPNLFLLLGPNTGLGHTSVVFMIESQIRYVVQALDLLDDTGAAVVEVRDDAQDRFVDRVQSQLDGTVWQSGCKSWYLDDRGRNSRSGRTSPGSTGSTPADRPADFHLVRVRRMATRSDV